MLEFIAKANRYMWEFVEFAFVSVLGIMLVYLVLGKDSGGFVLSVAGNVIKFTNDVPSGNLAAFGIVGALLYWFTHKNLIAADKKPSRTGRPARSTTDAKQLAAD